MAPRLNSQILEQLKAIQPEAFSEIVRELLSTFFSQSTVILADIENQIKDQNFKTASKSVHNLKSSSGALGAERLRELCHQIEHNLLSASMTLAQAQSEYNLLVAEYDLTCTELKTYAQSPN